MPFDILEEPICYSTFVTRKESCEGLKRCTRCRCAWYSSADEQRANWPIHKKVCKRPDYETVSKLTASQCMKLLGKGPYLHGGCDHNTAAIFERLFDLMRSDSDNGNDGVSNVDTGMALHSYSRVNSMVLGRDSLEEFYRHVWACPGMPQLLHFTDFRSSSLRKMMRLFPEGRPLFDDENEECNFDMEYDLDWDASGETIAWFIVGFLVRSCVWGGLSPASNHDGRGNLRDTNYATAAKHRLGEIFSSKILRDCAKKALYPVPGFILNIAENKPEDFLQLLNVGVGPAVIEWADLNYGHDTIRIMSTLEMRGLSDDTKLDMLEVCCNILGRHVSLPWSSVDDSHNTELIQLCSKIAVNLICSSPDLKGLLSRGMTRRPETSTGPQWVDNARDRKRMVLAFLFEKLTTQYDVSEDNIMGLLNQWGDFKMWEKTNYAKQVMVEKSFEWYRKQAEELLRYVNSKK